VSQRKGNGLSNKEEAFMADLGLEIYHLDVSGGDATAILVKDLEQETEKGGKTT
jgi:hypothetical protein